MIVLGDFLHQVLTSEKFDYIFSKSKLLIKTLFQIKGLSGEQQRTLWLSSIMSCVPSIVDRLLTFPNLNTVSNPLGPF